MKLWYNKYAEDYIIVSDDKTKILNICTEGMYDSLYYLIDKIKCDKSCELKLIKNPFLIDNGYEFEFIAEFESIEDLIKLPETHPEIFI